MSGELRPAVYSPDGRYRVAFSVYEMRMSHWVETPVIINSASGKPLLDLCTSDWSADTTAWRTDSQAVTFELRRYPGDAPDVTVTVDLPRRTCTVETAAGNESVSFDQVKAWLEEWYWRNRRRPGKK